MKSNRDTQADGADQPLPVGRRARLRRWTLTVTPLLAIGLWLAAHHRPDWYRPPVLDDEGLRRARRESANLFDEVSDRMVQGEPFDVTLVDASINEWLAALPHLLPEVGATWPKEVREPMLRFAPQGIQLAARFENRVGQVIVGVGAGLEVAPDRRTLSIHAVTVRAGVLPVPWLVLRRIVQPVMRETLGATDLASFDASPRIPNRFVWPNGDRPFRIESVHLEQGQCRIRIHPL